MKRIGFMLILIGFTLFIGIESRGTFLSNLGTGTDPLKEGEMHANESYIFAGKNKIYYSAAKGFSGELVILDSDQTERFLGTGATEHIKEIKLEKGGKEEFKLEKSGLYTLVIKNSSKIETMVKYTITHEGKIKNTLRKSLYIAIFGVIVLGIGAIREKKIP